MKPPSQWSLPDYETILYFGYYPDGENAELPPEVSAAATEEPIDGTHSELVTQGQDCLINTFEKCIRKLPPDAEHIVPLSGGLDSRTVLAGLLAHDDINKSTITTVSFGTPDTWDFELGQRVAAEAGVKNAVIDLTTSDLSWTVEDLEEAAAWAGKPVPILEARVNMAVAKRFQSDSSVIWSGYLGDPSVGSHQPTKPCHKWEDAVSYFIDHNEIATDHRYSVNFDPRTLFPSEPFIDRSRLTYEEQLDLAIRQQDYIKPVVAPNDNRYVIPFAHESWLSFWLNVPRKYRKGRRLFKKVVTKTFPGLFSLPTSTNYGLPITRHPVLGKLNGGVQIGMQLLKNKIRQQPFIHPSMNYGKFGELLRDTDSLTPVAEILLYSLKERGIIDTNIESLWQQHQSGSNHNELLHLLLSVESYIRIN